MSQTTRSKISRGLMIGTDIIEIARVEEAAKKKGFLERIFTPREMEYIQSKNNAPQTIAGLFAAKEAVVKALGTGFSRGVAHKDVEITHTESGAPEVNFKGSPEVKIFVSISHCREYATAAAVIK